MPSAELTELEGWKLRAIQERRLRAQLAIQAARSAHDQAQTDYQRAEAAFRQAMVDASLRIAGPANPEDLTCSLPIADGIPGTIAWADKGREVSR